MSVQDLIIALQQAQCPHHLQYSFVQGLNCFCVHACRLAVLTANVRNTPNLTNSESLCTDSGRLLWLPDFNVKEVPGK